MNLRSELLEVFGPEVGHALSISSWERLEDWVKRKLAEAQAETVEQCAKLGDEEAELFNLTADTGLDRIRCNAAKEASHRIATAIRALSPDPHARECWELEAKIRELHDWPELCNDDTDVPERHKRLCKYHRAIEIYDRQLAALSAVTP